MLRATEIVAAGTWKGDPADVVRLGLLTVFPGLSLWLLHYMS